LEMFAVDPPVITYKRALRPEQAGALDVFAVERLPTAYKRTNNWRGGSVEILFFRHILA